MTIATAVSFDADLMRRYDREGPRYTSYPTVLHFREGVDAEDYARAASGSLGALEGHPLSLYVHIPFCSSPCFYCGCNKIVTRQQDRADTYVRHLLREITQRGVYFDRNRVVEQMHFGGGTPTFLPQKLLTEIIERIDHDFQSDRRTRRGTIPSRSIRAASTVRCSRIWPASASTGSVWGCRISMKTCSAR